MIRARWYVGSNTAVAAFMGAGSRHEERSRAAVAVLARFGIDGATILPGVGAWKGAVELSMVVEVIGVDEHLIRAVAEALRATFDQDSVLWTIDHCIAGSAERPAPIVLDLPGREGRSPVELNVPGRTRGTILAALATIVLGTGCKARDTAPTIPDRSDPFPAPAPVILRAVSDLADGSLVLIMEGRPY